MLACLPGLRSAHVREDGEVALRVPRGLREARMVRAPEMQLRCRRRPRLVQGDALVVAFGDMLHAGGARRDERDHRAARQAGAEPRGHLGRARRRAARLRAQRLQVPGAWRHRPHLRRHAAQAGGFGRSQAGARARRRGHAEAVPHDPRRRAANLEGHGAEPRPGGTRCKYLSRTAPGRCAWFCNFGPEGSRRHAPISGPGRPQTAESARFRLPARSTATAVVRF